MRISDWSSDVCSADLRFPNVEWDPDVLYIDEGQVITSAGSAAGLDACLHLVRRDFGAAIANQLARRLVIQPHRDGGQAQFIERPATAGNRDRIAPAMQHMDSNRTAERREGKEECSK